MISSSRSAFIRRFAITLAMIVVAAPLLVWWSWLCVDSMFNTPHLWIPAENKQRAEFEWFVQHFESPALVIISWPGCTVDDPRLAQLEEALTNPEHSHYRAASRQLLDRVVSGHSVLRELLALNLSRSAALARLRGVLVGPDGQTSCAVIMFTEQGGYDRNEAIDVILETAQAVCRLDRHTFRLAGPPVDGVAIDKAGIETLKHFAWPSALVSLLMCWWCLRTLRYALAVLMAAAVGEGFCLALVFFSGRPMNALLILMPPLVFVLTIAAGVHLVHYYFDEARVAGIQDAPSRAIRAGWVPCLLAATTTAIGLGSLLVSGVEPIRMFGGSAAMGVLFTLLLLFLLLPGVMELWPIAVGKTANRELRAKTLLLRLADIVIRNATVTVVAAVILIAALGWGCGFVRTSVKLRDLFSPRDRLLDDYALLEATLGPLVPVEVILRFPIDSGVDFQTQLAFARAVSRQLRELPEVGGVMSAATFATTAPSATQVRKLTRQAIVTSRMTAARYLYESDTERCWRITARVPALGDLDYGKFLVQLEQRIAPIVDEFATTHDERIELTVTGALPLIYQTQRTLLADLAKSFAAAFGIVCLAMMLVLRSVRAGMIVMIPNVFPAAMVFGLMGWLGQPVDIGSLMTASIALGIAVVDTLHFLTWFRRDVAAGHEVTEAVRSAYRHCAIPMVQTSVICGIGMLVFVLSSFAPASRFAWMVLVLLAAALIGDLVILPALLTGPLGQAFAPQPAAMKSGTPHVS